MIDTTLSNNVLCEIFSALASSISLILAIRMPPQLAHVINADKAVQVVRKTALTSLCVTRKNYDQHALENQIETAPAPITRITQASSGPRSNPRLLIRTIKWLCEDLDARFKP